MADGSVPNRESQATADNGYEHEVALLLMKTLADSNLTIIKQTGATQRASQIAAAIEMPFAD